MKQSNVPSPAHPVLTEEQIAELRRRFALLSGLEEQLNRCRYENRNLLEQSALELSLLLPKIGPLLAVAASVGEMRALLRRCNEAALRAYDEGAGLPQYGWYQTDKVGRRQHWWNDGDGIDAALERKGE